MSWLLDADGLCQPVKTHGEHAVIEWLEREQDECYTSTIVIAQVAYWIRKKEGRARAAATIAAAERGRDGGKNPQLQRGDRSHLPTRNFCWSRPASRCRLRTATSPPPLVGTT